MLFREPYPFLAPEQTRLTTGLAHKIKHKWVHDKSWKCPQRSKAKTDEVQITIS